MSKLNQVLNLVESGAHVRVIQDAYGQKRIELKRTWLPFSRRIELDREEIALVEVALSSRARRSKSRVVVSQ
jgi:hypothetical protein